MLRVKRAVGAVAIAAMTMTGTALAAPPAAQAGILCTTLTAVTGPLVSGTGAVGTPLSVTTMPTWSCSLASAPTVQWWNTAGPIAGATGPTYTPTAADAGSAVFAVVTARVLGLLPVSVPSNPVSVPVLGDAGGSTPGDPVLDLVDPLAVTGSPAVGQLLAVAQPVWTLPGVATTYQWLRDGAAIPDATGPTYVPTLTDAGHTIAARVTGTLLGLVPVVRESGGLPVPVPDVSAQVLGLAGTVSTSGDRMVGTVLSAGGPTWDPLEAATTYQWLRDGVPISGATGADYLLRAVDYGHQISVTATGALPGWLARTVTSVPVVPVLGAPLSPGTAPRITGTPRAGGLLTADPGTWTGGDAGETSAPAFSYQWLRNGTPIDGAVAQTYQATASDIGTALAVAVTAVRPGYTSGAAETPAVAVAKRHSAVRAALAKKVVRRSERAVVKVRLVVPGVQRPTGTVRVLDGRHVVGKGTVRPKAWGSLSLRLARLKPGTHRLKAVYAGSPTVAASSSRVVRLTVRR